MRRREADRAATDTEAKSNRLLELRLADHVDRAVFRRRAEVDQSLTVLFERRDAIGDAFACLRCRRSDRLAKGPEQRPKLGSDPAQVLVDRRRSPAHRFGSMIPRTLRLGSTIQAAHAKPMSAIPSIVLGSGASYSWIATPRARRSASSARRSGTRHAS